MKRRRINLFSLTLRKLDFATVAKKIRFSMITVLLILLGILGLTAFVNNYLEQELASITKSKKPLLQYFENNSDFDKKIKYFIYKYSLLKDYLKQDADAYSYYLLLNKHIFSVSPNAVLTSFRIDNTGQTQFEIGFANFDEAELFLNALESPDFIKPFEYLKLSGFEVTHSGQGDFGLSIEGKFIK